eukprot:TRINITY_DN5472_c0_g1_i10.p1 TRINITY_DN5472_c0_g1~~TRINITY_DN5472_c0_g1_i10.p1  ORF type:complete len:203 (-),score=15.19 TRINITY_DN5472_c0_g1_i10:12-620(-)
MSSDDQSDLMIQNPIELNAVRYVTSILERALAFTRIDKLCRNMSSDPSCSVKALNVQSMLRSHVMLGTGNLFPLIREEYFKQLPPGFIERIDEKGIQQLLALGIAADILRSGGRVRIPPKDILFLLKTLKLNYLLLPYDNCMRDPFEEKPNKLLRSIFMIFFVLLTLAAFVLVAFLVRSRMRRARRFIFYHNPNIWNRATSA